MKTGEGLLQKISSGKLSGGLGVGWNAAEFYYNLEAIAWLVALAVLLVKGITCCLQWLF